MVTILECGKLWTEVTANASCSAPLVGGQQFPVIPDKDITSSSVLPGCSTNHSRLNSVEDAMSFGLLIFRLGNGGAWCANTLDQKQWIEWNLGDVKTITGVETQGRGSMIINQWVRYLSGLPIHHKARPACTSSTQWPPAAPLSSTHAATHSLAFPDPT